MTSYNHDIETYGWELHPYRAEWRRVIANADMGGGEEAVIEGACYECAGAWRWAVELQTPASDATVAMGAAPTLQLACARAAMAADRLLRAMRELTRGEGEA